jgi:hypothetical protein
VEDEKPFHGVRRLVQQEDYALHKLYLAGLPTPRPYGFVELSPEREYLLGTEFFKGAIELGDAEVDDRVIDDGLPIIRKLWEAGREKGRDLHAEFLRLLPARPRPIGIQRWSPRRIGLLLLMVPLAALLAVASRWVLINDDTSLTPLYNTSLGCTQPSRCGCKPSRCHPPRRSPVCSQRRRGGG